MPALGHRTYLDLGKRTAPTQPVRKLTFKPNHRKWSDPVIVKEGEAHDHP